LTLHFIIIRDSLQIHGPRAVCATCPRFLHHHLCEIEEAQVWGRSAPSLGGGQLLRAVLQVPQEDKGLSRHYWTHLSMVPHDGEWAGLTLGIDFGLEKVKVTR